MRLCRGTCIEVTVLRAWLNPGRVAPEAEGGVLTDSAPPLHLRKGRKKKKKKKGKKKVAHLGPSTTYMQCRFLPCAVIPGPYVHKVYESRDQLIRSKNPFTNHNHAVPLILSNPIHSRCASTFFSRRLHTGTDNCLPALPGSAEGDQRLGKNDDQCVDF